MKECPCNLTFHATRETSTLDIDVDSAPFGSTVSEDSESSESQLIIVLGYIYFVMTAVMSALSICGCIVIFVTYAAYKDLHTRGRRILVFLSIADILTATGNLMGVTWSLKKDVLPMEWCTAHSALTSFSSISSYFWNDCMALFLFVTLVRNRHELARKMIWGFHVLCWTVPALVMCISLSVGVYGAGGVTPFPSWCWIDTSLGQPAVLYWQLFCGKAWEIASYVWVVVVYALVLCFLKQRQKRRRQLVAAQSKKAGEESSSNRTGTHIMDDANRTLTFVPASFICLRIWGTLRFIIDTCDQDQTLGHWTAIFVPLQGIGDSGQGFANAVLYCALVAKVRSRLIAAFRRCCGNNVKVGSAANTQHSLTSSRHSQPPAASSTKKNGSGGE